MRISIANVSRIYKYGFYSDQLLFLEGERKMFKHRLNKF